jgi:hypothetical protein
MLWCDNILPFARTAFATRAGSSVPVGEAAAGAAEAGAGAGAGAEGAAAGFGVSMGANLGGDACAAPSARLPNILSSLSRFCGD